MNLKRSHLKLDFIKYDLHWEHVHDESDASVDSI